MGSDAQTTTAAEEPLPVLPYETPPPEAGPKRWHAGTLTYTRGRLSALFFWLLSGDFFWQFRERAIGPAIPLLLR